jgi:hypothetical protein
MIKHIDVYQYRYVFRQADLPKKESKMKDENKTFDLITHQQTIAYEAWEEQRKEDLDCGIIILPFKTWYVLYCAEKGWYDDSNLFD